MFIRYWAPTNTTASASFALDYCQALLRFHPVRLISLTGQLEGRWGVMARLLETNMITPMINVVCADQEHWVTTVDVGMPDKDGMREALATGKQPTTKIETVKHERELYTMGVRNVLIANKLPTLKRYAVAAAKYEAIVVSDQERCNLWATNQRAFRDQEYGRGVDPAELFASVDPVCVPVPITDLRTLRTAILGN